ncbi:DUF559 domain-containing protein [Microbacteriaceae bacterium VKM Ac-2855]|nr:DUF559 domain-containing protein [Microbacteriaceae bacterium VKM Ac-2855]
MRRIERDITELGGLAATHQLLARGHHDRYLTWAVHAGVVIRVRQGWYCLPDLNETTVRAVRVGGLVACTSALAMRKVWVLDAAPLHVAVHARDARLRTSIDRTVRLADQPESDVVVHWSARRFRQSQLVQSVEEALVEVVSCQSAESAFASIESALEKRLISAARWASLARGCPGSRIEAIGPVARGAGSGVESIFQHRAAHLRLSIRRQVWIEGFARVDFLVGERLVVEIQSRSHHDPLADARRAARLSALGYRVLFLGYDVVIHDWPLAEAALVAAVVRGDHLAA